jgi:transcriptional regulator with XRE-family HTH domain
MIDSAQCRAARALIGWSRNQLAEASTVALRTIVDFERGARDPRAGTRLEIQRALENEGVIFLFENGDGPGVRKAKRK